MVSAPLMHTRDSSTVTVTRHSCGPVGDGVGWRRRDRHWRCSLRANQKWRHSPAGGVRIISMKMIYFLASCLLIAITIICFLSRLSSLTRFWEIACSVRVVLSTCLSVVSEGGQACVCSRAHTHTSTLIVE